MQTNNTFNRIYAEIIGESTAEPDAVLLVSTAEPDPVNFTVTTFIEGNRNRSNYVATYGSTTRVSFPPHSVYITNSSQRDRAILVQAEEGKTISVYGVAEDGFLALPCDGMKVENFKRYEYIIFSGESPPYLQALSGFLIIPCEENTRINITPSQLVTVEADDFKTAQFGPNSSYFLLSATWEDSNGNLPSAGATLMINNLKDLTGSVVSGDKPLAVFSGHQCASVLMKYEICGHLVEQIPPHTTSGSTFFLTPLAVRETGDYYRVATVHDNTEVTITCVDEGGSTVETRRLSLGSGQNWGEYLTQDGNNYPLCINPFIRKFCSLQATNPVIVAQYGQGYISNCFNGSLGGPFLSFIPSVMQSLNNYTISMIKGDLIRGEFVGENARYISVSVRNDSFDPSRIMIDGVPVEPHRSAWQGIYCSDGEICGYGIYREIENSDHIVYHESENAALTVQNYGFQASAVFLQNFTSNVIIILTHTTAYGFSTGMELQPISGIYFFITTV